MDPTAIVAIITLAGSLLISAFTRKSAQSDRVVSDYVSLVTSLRGQVDFQGQQIKELQQVENRRNKAHRLHEPWDRAAIRALPDEFPPPPPLDVWE